MKSYLSLIPISAKVHKRRNRMTLFCIIIAVFLVTSIFSMADMGVRMEKIRAINRHGNWHIQLSNVSENDAKIIGSSPHVAAASWYDVINYDMNDDYYISGKKAIICGADEMFITDIMNGFTEKSYPKGDKEIILTANAKDIFGVNIGDIINVETPFSNVEYTISGFSEDTNFTMQHDTIGAFMNMTAFEELSSICESNSADKSSLAYYVQFDEHTNIRKAIIDVKEQYGLTDENIAENTALLGITGFSGNSYMMGLYLISSVLFVLILAAGVLMIAGSINSNISERSQFFGMMRCIGASKNQIIRFVRLEALGWCKTAIPIGVALGIAITWGICAVLRLGIGGEFADMPLFGFSIVGVVSGVVVGVMTVLIAAQTPAKRASVVSPMAAVSGMAGEMRNTHHAANTKFPKIDIALGIHHAVSAKKNLILMTGSFALSIILFLSFSAVLDFTHHAISPLRPYTPDVSIISNDNTCTVNRDLIVEINGRPGVKRVFGRMFSGGILVETDRSIDKIDLISYENYQFNWTEESDYIIEGDLSKVLGNNNYVLTVYDKSNPLKVGDKIYFNENEVEIAGILSTSPFDSTQTPTVICSEETFTRLTNEHNYSIIDIQMTSNATDEDAKAIRDMVGNKYIFSDRRESNKEATGTYWAFSLLVYSFLAIIAMITVFNIINSISMSVSAKIKQYKIMRAVGMDGRQITKMVATETVTYALCGCIVGCVLGLPLNRFLFEHLVTAYWGDAWNVPVFAIVIILLLVAGASAMSVYIPLKRIKNMSVTDNINEQ